MTKLPNQVLAGALKLCLILSLTSCVDTKKAVYFSGQQETTLNLTVPVSEPKIEPNDLLSITVNSLNQEASALFNMPNLALANVSSYNSAFQASGYLVNSDGYIQFPVLGNLKVAGLTENELRLTIIKSLTERKLLIDPIVNVRHLNFKVTVLGEVSKPTVISVPNEKITLLEALGMAGDITIYGKKDNVMIIRDDNGKKIIKRIDLSSTDLFSSPYYYLRSNDIVYVEPGKAKIASGGRTIQTLPLIFSGLSLTAIVLDQIFRKR
jgi:polysaccharide export outer membrane protein